VGDARNRSELLALSWAVETVEQAVRRSVVRE
jgi:hypothetical protein